MIFINAKSTIRCSDKRRMRMWQNILYQEKNRRMGEPDSPAGTTDQRRKDRHQRDRLKTRPGRKRKRLTGRPKRTTRTEPDSPDGRPLDQNDRCRNYRPEPERPTPTRLTKDKTRTEPDSPVGTTRNLKPERNQTRLMTDHQRDRLKTRPERKKD